MNQRPVEEVLRDLPQTEATKRQVLEWMHSMESDFPALSGHRNHNDEDLEGEIHRTQDWIWSESVASANVVSVVSLLKHRKGREPTMVGLLVSPKGQ